MHFSELVLQGVRNFSQTHRFSLGSGFTALAGGPGVGKTTIVELLLHLLFPDTTELATQAFRSASSEVCRAALTIDDGRGQVYRLVKDLVRGSTALTRFDAGAQQFAPISSSPAEILQYLSSTLHLPHGDVFEGIYVVRDGDLPSGAGAAPEGGALDTEQTLGVGLPPGAMRASGGSSGKAGARRLPPSSHFQMDDTGGGPSFPGYQGFDDGGEVLPDDSEEIRSQIEILERDIANIRAVDDLQFELDGLQSEMFALDRKSKGVREAQGRIEDLQESLEQFGNLDELPDDFEARVRSYEQDKAHLDRDLVRVKEDRERWEKKAAQSVPLPLRQNRNFLLGLGGGIVALTAGVAGFFMSEPLRWIALADILFFGIALVAAIRHIDQTMGVERSRARLAMIDERQQKLERQFELESAVVRRTMQQVNAESPARVLEMYSKRNKIKEALQEAQQTLAEQKAQAGLTEAESRRSELNTKIDEIEGRLAGMSGMMMSVTDMERRLELLHDKLAWIDSGGQGGQDGTAPPSGPGPYDLGVGAPPGALGGGDGASVESAGTNTAGPDVCQRLVKLAEDLFLVGAEKLNATLAPRAGQFLAALSSQAYSQLSLDDRAEVRVYEAASGLPVTVASLPPEARDLVYLALEFGIIEVFSKQQPIPVFLDDPFKRQPPEKHDLIGRILAGIGRTTQVVLLTSQSELSRHATASFSL